MNFQVIELGTGIPFHEVSPTEQISFQKKYLLTHADARWDGKPGRQSFYKEVVEMDMHCISHIDSLNHVALDQIGFNNSNCGGVPTEYENGAEITPLIEGKALMIDLCQFLETTFLADDCEITSKLLKKCLKHQRAKIGDYKIILIRTGHIRHWKNGDYDRYLEKEVGLSIEAIEWLAEKDIIAVGADNFAVESIPEKEKRNSNFYPGHKKLLYEKGIYIMENLDLENLARKNIDKFYFIAAPIRIRHASAALINPVAIISAKRSSVFRSSGKRGRK